VGAGNFTCEFFPVILPPTYGPGAARPLPEGVRPKASSAQRPSPGRGSERQRAAGPGGHPRSERSEVSSASAASG